MTMPKQKPGKSKQDYGTPKIFLDAVRKRLKIKDFGIDLAASMDNRVVPAHFDEGQDSLKMDWATHLDGEWGWLNPPFGKISPWVEKAAKESMNGAQIAMLVPASVGANWWATWVEPYAYQVFLNGRVTFVGEVAPFPKDSALLLYHPWGFLGHEIWHWKNQVG